MNILTEVNYEFLYNLKLNDKDKESSLYFPIDENIFILNKYDKNEKKGELLSFNINNSPFPFLKPQFKYMYITKFKPIYSKNIRVNVNKKNLIYEKNNNNEFEFYIFLSNIRSNNNSIKSEKGIYIKEYIIKNDHFYNFLLNYESNFNVEDKNKGNIINLEEFKQIDINNSISSLNQKNIFYSSFYIQNNESYKSKIKKRTCGNELQELEEIILYYKPGKFNVLYELPKSFIDNDISIEQISQSIIKNEKEEKINSKSLNLKFNSRQIYGYIIYPYIYKIIVKLNNNKTFKLICKPDYILYKN